VNRNKNSETKQKAAPTPTLNPEFIGREPRTASEADPSSLRSLGMTGFNLMAV
jgi:hypothetical protein